MKTWISDRSHAVARVLIPLLLLSGTVGCQTDGAHHGGDDEHHILELRAGDVMEIQGWSRTSLVIGGNHVWMAPEIAVDEGMIAEVERTGAEGRSLVVTLDAEGTENLRRLSTAQLSRPIVVVVDDRPSSAPIMMSPLETEFRLTADHLTDEEWDDFVHRLSESTE
ncbi:MAG: hypothetical protein CMJ23_04855 [Phycisphaerae bacterium]|nr:hypothetical protein [Phycisphaerae bacterium]|tara:strand:+ start:174 stop:671 length:498 start_codon:yes stop_codon:yes gene_type:complete